MVSKNNTLINRIFTLIVIQMNSSPFLFIGSMNGIHIVPPVTFYECILAVTLSQLYLSP